MDGFRQDIRFGLRTLGKSRAHTVVVLLSLALGIGANTAVFSLVDALLLKKLPVADPDRLVQLVRNVPSAAGQEMTFSYPQVERFRAADALADIVAATAARISASNGGDPEVLIGMLVTGNYFDVLGVPPERGRMLQPDDDRSGAPPVAVVSHAYWTRSMSADPSAIGRPLTINGVNFVVVGIAPPEFLGVSPGFAPDLWVALHQQPRIGSTRPWVDDMWSMRLTAMGRLRPQQSMEAAQAKLAVVFENIKSESIADADVEQRKTIAQSSFALVPGSTGYSGLRQWIAKTMLLLMGVVGLVLLIACANVAGLQLARGAARRQELAVRVALGAQRGRLMRQLLTESMLLAIGGGALGLLLGQWCRWLLARWFPSGPFHQLFVLAADAKVLLFTLLAVVLTGALFGIAPALWVTRFDVQSALRAGGRGATQSSGLGKVLVTAQVALSLVLLLAANLLIRSLANLETLNLGFDAEHLLLVRVDPGIAGYRGADLHSFNRQLREQLAAIPGAQGAAAARVVPGEGLSWPEAFSLAGEPGAADGMIIMRDWIAPDYFRTLGASLLLGREFSERDNGEAPRVAMINEAFARRYFPGQNPIGRSLHLRRSPGVSLEIVGVAADTTYDTVWKEVPPVVFTPTTQSDAAVVSFLVRSGGDPAALAGEARAAVKSIGKNVPVLEVLPYPEFVQVSLARNRLMASVLSFFSTLGLVLVAIGLYALMATAVTSRLREIGVRMALGAGRHMIVKMVLREGLLLGAAGALASIPLSYFASRLLRGYLFHLHFLDPLALVLTLAMMLGVTIVALCVPALRASRVEPIAALRCE